MPPFGDRSRSTVSAHSVHQADADLPYDARDVISDVLGDLGIPILYGFPSGHCARPLALPFGVAAAIRGGRLVLCESPVAAQD